MSANDNTDQKDNFVFTDIDRNPITCDNNPARFDGLLLEIANCCKRTGKFLELQEQGVAIRGHRTIIDSPSAVPFIQGRLTAVRVYGPEDPCPPTNQRIAEHNARMTNLGSPTVVPLTRLLSSSEYTVNAHIVRQEDTAFGEAIASCFAGHADYIARARDEAGMGGRDLIAHLKMLARQASPAQHALVLRQFTKFAEAPVPVTLDEALFEEWYKGFQKVHRALPGSKRKDGSAICGYINILLYAQPQWRDTFETRMASNEGQAAEGDLNKTLAIVRKMLGGRSTYAQLDAEQQGTTINTSLVASHSPSSAGLVAGGGNKGGTNESNSIKRAFSALVASGDTAAAFAVAAQAGLSRSTSDPKKTGTGGGGGGGDSEKYVPLPRDANGRITKFVTGSRPCFCGLPHLHRECKANDMWKQDSDKKWHWVGGKDWVNGNPPSGFNRSGAAAKVPKVNSSATGKTHAAKVVEQECDDDSDLASQLVILANERGIDDSHEAKVVTNLAKNEIEITELSDQHDIEPVSTSPGTEPEPDVVSVDADAAPLSTSFEMRLRNLASDSMSAISANYCTIIFVVLLAIIVAVFFIPFLQGLSGPMTRTNAGTLHPAFDKVPATMPGRPDHYGLAIYHGPPAPRAAVSRCTLNTFFGLFGWLVASIVYYKLYFLYISIEHPTDVLRTLAYCAAAPLAICPVAYQWTLGLGPGRKRDSFFSKAVCSINKLRVYGGPFSLLTFMAIFLSRFSPLAATTSSADSTCATVSAPEFARATDAPAVTSITLPFLGKWLPSEIESGGGVVHSYNSALLDAPPDAAAHTAFNVTIAKSTSVEETNKRKLLSSLPIVAATVDSGCSASLTYNCSLLVNTSPCDEVFGAANGVLAKATLIGSLPLVALAKSGEFVHFMLTNVRCVPDFSNFTLLSVDQMWEEQRVRSLFCDSKQLELPQSSGGHVIPYDTTAGRNTVKFASAVKLYKKGALSATEPVNLQAAKVALGFHDIKSTAHVARLSGAQVGELMHRRWHRPVRVIREAANICSDTPSNLSRADNVSCEHCAASHATKASHGDAKTTTVPSNLPPSSEPGTLHIDLKGMMIRSVHGYHYAMFAVDEFSRFIFVEFLKTKEKREITTAAAQIISRFNAMVNAGCDDQGRPLPKPRVKVINSDHEAALESKFFESFRTSLSVASTMSPPHDHDLNPIAERSIGVISELACAIRSHSNAPASVWPHLIEHAVNIHNSTSSSCGTSMADPIVSAHQRLTRTQPSAMDIASFGCQAVVLKPPPERRKSDLSSRGYVGKYLGRALGGKTGQWQVLADGKLITSSAVQVDEESFPWHGRSAKQPLAPARPSSSSAHASRGGQDSSNPSTASTSDRDSLCALNLFSGPYARAEGLSPRLKQQFGWHRVIDIDNDPDASGGWSHDLLNDETFSKVLMLATRGAFDAMMVAFPCSTFSASRLFPSDPPGPPPVRSKTHPDGLPDDEIDPKYKRELRLTNTLLERTVQIVVAARNSSRKTTIILENPADRSIPGTKQYGVDTAAHGSIWATEAFKQLASAIPDSSMVTFAYCRFGSDYQKYTTLWYTNEAGPILDQLNSPVYQCNHARHPKVAGGRRPDGTWASAAAAAYPAQLNIRLAMALTLARTGDPSPVSRQAISDWTSNNSRPDRSSSAPGADAAEPDLEPSALEPPPSAAPPSFTARRPLASPLRGFPDLDSPTEPSPILGHREAPRQGRNERTSRSSTLAQRSDESYNQQLADLQTKQAQRQNEQLEPVDEDDDSPYDTYSPFRVAPGSEGAYFAHAALEKSNTTPAGAWVDVGLNPSLAEPPPPDLGQEGVLETEDLARVLSPPQMLKLLSSGELPAPVHKTLLAVYHAALRADSLGAPSTHPEAMAMDATAGDSKWKEGERVELNNHERNGSWELISRCDVPRGRRIHKLVWVYKIKRDGQVKVRLCVQGCTLEHGIDFDQTFSSTLRHCSARALFGHAARQRCSVRSIDFVSAYLQGAFLDGEVVYCHMPTGYVEFGPDGAPLVCCIKKPVYGIPQAGRRLQRGVFDWMLDTSKAGLRQLDDSDNTIFIYDDPSGKETFAVGVYVDNLQLVHSVPIDDDGNATDPDSYLARFLNLLRADWEVVDEGPMHDLLGMECEPQADGSIKLHQCKYIKKLLARYLPNGPPKRAKPDTLPYSDHIHTSVEAALQLKDEHGVVHPELVTPFQQRCGSYLYLVTSTRPDLAYPVTQLCRAMSCPTPELMVEFDRIAVYLHFNPDIGITYRVGPRPLEAFADASWETRFSTSGWVVLWQGAAISWGSRKQDCVALSSCEAEIIALSECSKDVIYYRKKLIGIDPSYVTAPTNTSTDNKGAHDLSYNPEFHARSKHIKRRHFYVRDMVEAHELVVPLVKTDVNPADFFTKPMPLDKFIKFRDFIMNIGSGGTASLA